MSDFRRIDDRFLASPQITTAHVDEARAMGVTMIVNNRPEGEASDQTPGAEIERAAEAAGIAYRAIPISHAGFGEAQVQAMDEALSATEGPVLAYCRSGTRSTLLWALAAAKRGENPATIAARAASGGYDIAPVRQLVEMLSAGAGK